MFNVSDHKVFVDANKKNKVNSLKNYFSFNLIIPINK